MSALFITIYTD